MKSNITIKSNLMLDLPEFKPEHRWLPGDFVRLVYPSKVDTRSIEKELTERQIIEVKQYLVCLICGMPCAGTCERER